MSADMRVRFTASCRGSFGPHKMTYDWEPGSEGRRLRSANFCHGLELDEQRCRLTPKKVQVAGFVTLPPPTWPRKVNTAADAIPTLVSFLRWTLCHVYGHGFGAEEVAMPGLRLTVQEVPLETSPTAAAQGSTRSEGDAS